MATHTITITSNTTLAAAITAGGVPADTGQPFKIEIYSAGGTGQSNAGMGGGGGGYAAWNAVTIANPSACNAVFVAGVFNTVSMTGTGVGSLIVVNGSDGVDAGVGGDDGTTSSDTAPDVGFLGGAGGAGSASAGGGGGGAATADGPGHGGFPAASGGAGGTDGSENPGGGNGGGVGSAGSNATNGGGGGGGSTKAGGTGTAGKVVVTYTVLTSSATPSGATGYRRKRRAWKPRPYWL